MAKNQSNDITEQVSDTPEIVVEKTEAEQSAEQPVLQQTIVKKNGTALSLLAILIALGVGGAGYYIGQQQVTDFQKKLIVLENQVGESASRVTSNEKNEQVNQLESGLKAMQEKVIQLEEFNKSKTEEITTLQAQIKQVSQLASAQQPNDWLFSEVDFLLNNALRKLILDNDVDTAISLLKLADETLVKINNTQANSVRNAINQDLKKLLSLSSVDQNSVMQKLSQLANTVDELQVLNVNFDDTPENNNKLSDSIEDWQQNVEKSATSFLNHFIRISPKQSANKKELLAPNQDIYLRENIRLRLQLAIMAVPRQQDELYKQSLDAVSSWVRSYFDTNSETTQNFLKSVDELSELSIYVDVPEQLASLTLLDKYLNRLPLDVQKVEIETDKAVESMPKVEDTMQKSEDKPAKAEHQQ
ncbi:uroporphyrinogen-III C-methyltransferase [Haemophilus seminalis]|jgi:putative uroporphyrinogen-III C-methyltransferase|uniref:uroporphyrinogen-III C-methyltransferase n=1 Tax=Haemophilus seminalis TaxID=2582921 RepID=UPI002552BA09|nr:uroporphyrinogen-III C-methyltransferase [Haemophilus seminalis]MDK7281548.1 uroporphyrinogen-III C-methyltransferase [Haemophilus seminalis]